LKLWDKNAALEKAYRRKGAFERDNKQKGTDPLSLMMQWINERGIESGTHGLPINFTGTTKEHSGA
jgi:hypothetical protein